MKIAISGKYTVTTLIIPYMPSLDKTGVPPTVLPKTASFIPTEYSPVTSGKRNDRRHSIVKSVSIAVSSE